MMVRKGLSLLLLGSLLLGGAISSGCKVGPGAAAFMAVATGAAVGAAAHSRARGGCYGLCGPGTACDPVSGHCVVSACGQCPPEHQCDASQKPPRCIPVISDGLHIQTRAERSEDPDPAGAPPDSPVAPDQAAPVEPLVALAPGQCLKATHFYPAWPTPAEFQTSLPLFYVRFNQVLNPERVVEQARIAVGAQGWKSGQFFLRHSYVVQCPEGTCTEVFFGLEKPIPENSMVTWAIQGARGSILGPACPGSEQNGAYVYSVFRTADEKNPPGSLDSSWSRVQLARTYGQQQAEAMLDRQGQTMNAVQAYRTRAPRANPGK